MALGIVLLVLVIWEWQASAGNVSSLFFPAPTTIVRTLVTLTQDGTIPSNTVISLRRLSSGLLAGGLPGMLIGLMLGWSKPLREVFDPLIAAIHPIPKISILPMIILIFGLGETSKLIIVGLATFFPMLINSMAGVYQLSPTYFDVAENYGLSRWATFRRVVLPGSLPMILTGVRLALNSALVLTIVIELVMSQNGLGDMIGFAWNTLRTTYLYATLCVIAALGTGFNEIVRFLTRRLVPWHQEQMP
jgi:NitT/TauT family transport system permease protein